MCLLLQYLVRPNHASNYLQVDESPSNRMQVLEQAKYLEFLATQVRDSTHSLIALEVFVFLEATRHCDVCREYCDV